VKEWCVAVGGGTYTRKRWPTKCYTTKAAANRRRKYIRKNRTPGVSTVWVFPKWDR